jgi:septum formation protein
MTSIKALDKLNAFDIVLASKSPRRKELLKGIGLKFRILNHLEMDEAYPLVLQGADIPMYLAKAKAAFYEHIIAYNTLLITADTIVWLENEVIGKPYDASDAREMLRKLSGRMHEVFTGVCLKTADHEVTFSACSQVYFKKLTEEEILYYVDRFQPLDKAGAYGVQEWIGIIGVERIEGSYFNVMGLPVQQLYVELLNFTAE